MAQANPTKNYRNKKAKHKQLESVAIPDPMHPHRPHPRRRCRPILELSCLSEKNPQQSWEEEEEQKITQKQQ
jgi:hypothetical protein